MKLHPEQLTYLGNSKYRIRIATSCPSGVREFDFAVEGDDIRVVVSPQDFGIFLSYNFGPVKHLLEAILDLDRAQGVEILQQE